MIATLAPTRTATLLPAPFALTDHLAVDVDGADAEAYCPGCGEGIGEVGAYTIPWVSPVGIDAEIHNLLKHHLRYDGGPDCRGE